MTPDDLAGEVPLELRKLAIAAMTANDALPEDVRDQTPDHILAAVLPALSVRITVTCDCGTVIDQYTGSIAEKYPFTCPECDDIRHDKYPWKISTEIIRNEKR